MVCSAVSAVLGGASCPNTTRFSEGRATKNELVCPLDLTDGCKDQLRLGAEQGCQVAAPQLRLLWPLEHVHRRWARKIKPPVMLLL